MSKNFTDISDIQVLSNFLFRVHSNKYNNDHGNKPYEYSDLRQDVLDLGKKLINNNELTQINGVKQNIHTRWSHNPGVQLLVDLDNFSAIIDQYNTIMQKYNGYITGTVNAGQYLNEVLKEQLQNTGPVEHIGQFTRPHLIFEGPGRQAKVMRQVKQGKNSEIFVYIEGELDTRTTKAVTNHLNNNSSSKAANQKQRDELPSLAKIISEQVRKAASKSIYEQNKSKINEKK